MKLPEPFTSLGDHITVELSGAQALFTTRRGGVSAGPYATLNLGRLTDDDPEAVVRNRARVQELVGRPLAMIRQVHGSHVRQVERPPRPDEPLIEADAQVSTRPGLAPMVLVADCLPIALAAPGAVGVVHAGWRGLAGGVVAETVRCLRAAGAYGELHAAIGPGAGGCCYEVGEEVHAQFASYGPAVRRGDNLDLKAIARTQLLEAGATSVHDVALCTICGDPELFFSHRRDGGVTGRQAGIAWLS